MKLHSIALVLSLITLGGCSVGTSEKSPSSSQPAAPAKEKDPSEMLTTGTKAPDFSVADEAGNTVALADFAGKQNVVLIFYPGDDTPGCTKQLCAARDSWDAYKDADVQVLGVNPGSAESHQKFVDKYSFPFPILVDSEKVVISAYGAKGLLFTTRTVYGIDKSGTIVFAERGMPTSDEILAAFATSSGG